jgi:GLPGLI family protein
MLRRIIILAALFFIQNLLFGQERKQILATYLLINSNANETYTIETRIDQYKSLSEFFKISSNSDTIIAESEENLKIFITNKDTTTSKYYVSKDSIVFLENIFVNRKFTPVVVEEKTPQFNWQLKEGSSIISGMICNSASLNFRGRNFIVWYSPDIPTPFGPWKFYGLPGLITKVESDDKSILFQLSKLSYVNKEDIKRPSSSRTITLQEYIRLQQSVFDDYLEKLRTQLPRGATVSISKQELNGIERIYE